MKKLLLTSLVALGAAMSGCQSVSDYLIQAGQADAPHELHANGCTASLTKSADGQPVGKLDVHPEHMAVVVQGELRGLPPAADFDVSVRRNSAATLEEAGPLMGIPGTNATGVIGSFRTSASGAATVNIVTDHAVFDGDLMLGRGLCITDADGNLVASGVLGVSAEHAH